jgi:Ser/Thr protein kinase RdoA (MazF antagonist)
MNISNTPYATLSPSLILDAVESLGFQATGSVFALNSYENRVYQIGVEGAAPWIVKFYRPGRLSDEAILEEHAFALELEEHEIPVVAPFINAKGKTLHQYEGFRFALFPRLSGRALELDQLDQLEWMGRFIGRMHAVGAVQQFHHRPAFGIASHGKASYEFLMKQNFIPDYLKENYSQTVLYLLTLIEAKFAALGQIRQLRLHGDMHAGNVLWNITGPHVVDLDDAVMGPAIQDIWMLLSGDAAQMQLQVKLILEGYRQFHEFDQSELILIEALRTLRMLYYSAWLARRFDDPAFPLSFPWFNTPAYWQKQWQDLAEQIPLLEE